MPAAGQGKDTSAMLFRSGNFKMESSPNAAEEVDGDAVQGVVNAKVLEPPGGCQHDEPGDDSDDDCAVMLHHGTCRRDAHQPCGM